MDATSSNPLMTQQTSDLYETPNLTNSTDPSGFVDDGTPVLIYINRFACLFTCIVGSIGNLLVIFTIWRVKRLHTVMYFAVANLGVADLLLCLLYLPFILAELFNGERWLWGRAACKLVFYIYQMSFTVSILNLTVVSIDRFIAVRYPLKSQQYLTMGNAKRSAIIIWIFALVYSAPVLYGQDTWEHIRDGNIVENCYLVLKGWFQYQIWYLVYLCIPVFAIPSCIISLCCAAIIYTMVSRKVPREQEAVTSQRSVNQDGTKDKTFKADETVNKKLSSERKELKRLIITLMLVVLLFIICWGPYFLMLVLYSYRVFVYSLRIEKILNMFSLLAILNSAINPLVYAFLSPTFRTAFITAVTSLFR